MRRQCCSAAAASAGSHSSRPTPACARAWLASAKICSRLGRQVARPLYRGAANPLRATSAQIAITASTEIRLQMTLISNLDPSLAPCRSIFSWLPLRFLPPQFCFLRGQRTRNPAWKCAGRTYLDPDSKPGWSSGSASALSRRAFPIEIVARSDHREKKKCRQSHDAGQQKEPCPADLLRQAIPPRRPPPCGQAKPARKAARTGVAVKAGEHRLEI